MKYTRETLQKINPSYLEMRDMISEKEVEMVNEMVELIERTRSKDTPKAGDYLRYTDKYGEYFPHAHIEYTTEERYGGNVCENGSCAHIIAKEDGSGISCNGSGGPWCDVDPSEMKYVGEEEKTFWIWGSWGARAHGGVYFKAKVSVWEYVDPELFNTEDKDENGKPFTTKDYDRFYISKVDHKREKDSLYDYRVSSGITNCNAFRNEDEMKAWLWTYRGKIFDHSNLGYNKVVWTWKSENHSNITPAEYDELDLPEDTMLMNGNKMRCKRKWEEETHTVHTYYVWYWDEEAKDGEYYGDVYMRQNKIREERYVLPYETPLYSLARKELSA